jgi:molybdopterin molybdotransferase
MGAVVSTVIRVSEALKHILDDVCPLPLEKVPLLNGLGRVLGEDIFASRNIPPLNNSAMDGYVIRSADSLQATPDTPVQLRVIGEIPAGRMTQQELASGEAAQIMTGGILPPRGDTVVRLEDVRREGEWIFISSPYPPEYDVRMAGSDVKCGDVVVQKGTVLGAADIGMIAATSRSFVFVYQRPTVAIISTGDELVDVDQEPSLWEIININGYAGISQISECGAIPLYMGIAMDNKEDIGRRFQDASRADVIISSGGISLGNYDFVRDVIADSGNNLHFWQVAMKPGKPLAYGRVHGKIFFGLPGNPSSSMISFEQFVRPALLKMMGHTHLFRRTVRAVVEENIEKKEGMTHFIRSRVEWRDGCYRVVATGDPKTNILKSMAGVNGLIVLPEKATTLKKGDEATIQLIDHSFCLTSEPHYL